MSMARGPHGKETSGDHTLHTHPDDARAFFDALRERMDDFRQHRAEVEPGFAHATHDDAGDPGTRRATRTTHRHGHRAPLDRAQIVQAALELADGEGIEAVSMRRVAGRLGVGTMSLYGHVADKQTLVEHMVDAVFGEYQAPALTGDWRTDATALAHVMRSLLTRHPWIPALGSARPLLTPALYRNLMDHMEYSLSVYDPLDIDIREAAAFDMLVDTYVTGFVARELDDRHESDESREFMMQFIPQLYQLLTDGQHPRMAAFMASMEPRMLELLSEGADPTELLALMGLENQQKRENYQDELFDLGLECILDGIAARLVKAS